MALRVRVAKSGTRILLWTGPAPEIEPLAAGVEAQESRGALRPQIARVRGLQKVAPAGGRRVVRRECSGGIPDQAQQQAQRDERRAHLSGQRRASIPRAPRYRSMTPLFSRRWIRFHWKRASAFSSCATRGTTQCKRGGTCSQCERRPQRSLKYREACG